MIYLIGSLRNTEIPKIANQLRKEGLEVFDEWYSAGEFADDSWRDHQKGKGLTFLQALQGPAARNVFEFDKRYLSAADQVVLVCPAGKSGHLELGWALGRGKSGYILLDNPDRWDVMYQFATLVTDKLEDIVADIKRDKITLGTCSFCEEPLRTGQAMTYVGNEQHMHWECYEGCQESTTNITGTLQQELFTLEGEPRSETLSAT